jgi:hypothetical protein
MRAYAFLLLPIVACAPPTVSSVDPGGNGPGSAGGSGGRRGMNGSGGSSGRAPDAGFGFTVADASSTTSSLDTAGAACAHAKVGAQQVPVDLLILLDNSGSMSSAAGMRSKWATAQDALVTFVKDPASVGLGVGLAFFPRLPELQPCTDDADCPSADCRENDLCLGAAGAVSGYRCFPAGGGINRCPLGGMCTPQGLCSMTKVECRTVGAACPSGVDGDMCVRSAKVCSPPADADACNVADYQKPGVPIAPLPGNQAKLVTVINGRTTYGDTPTGVALRGAFEHLRAHLQANPGRRGAVVLTTDGLPSGCMPTDPPGIAADIRAARMGTPPIDTYVIGVFASTEAPRARPALEMFATSGGTGMPFLLDATADLGQRLNEALAKIRGEALPCEFLIPAGSGAIDFGRVNVTLESNGQEQTVPYVQGMDRCDPTTGGWYYDVAPPTGTPSRILTCPATCETFKAEREPKVSLVFGCESVVVK